MRCTAARPPINPEDFSKPTTSVPVISQVDTDAYYWRQDPATNTFQLMHYDLFADDHNPHRRCCGLRSSTLGDAIAALGPETTWGLPTRSDRARAME